MKHGITARLATLSVIAGAMTSIALPAFAQTDVVAGHILELSSLEPPARIEAARQLGELRDPVAVVPLVRTLTNDTIPEVRGWAIRSLHQIATQEARAAVATAATADPDERVRALAETLIARAEPETVPLPFEEATSIQPTETPTTSAPAQASRPIASARLSVTVRPAPTAQPLPFAQAPAPLVRTEPIVQIVPVSHGPQTYAVEQRPERRRRPGLGLRIAGWSLFGLGYLESSLIFGSLMNDVYGDGINVVYVPVIGPLIAAARLEELTDGWDQELICVLARPMFIIGSLMQITGLALAIAGHARGRRARREALSSRRSTRRVAVVPGGPTGVGAGVVGIF